MLTQHNVSPQVEGLTESDGTFVLRMQHPGAGKRTYLILVPRRAGYASAGAAVVCEPGRWDKGGVRILQRGLADLGGLVTDGFDQPLEGVSVTYTSSTGGGDPLESFARTDEQGKFRFAQVSEGDLKAEKTGYVHAEGYRARAGVDGSFGPACVVMLPECSLSIGFLNGHGKPMVGEHIRAQILGLHKGHRGRRGGAKYAASVWEKRTDEFGQVYFPQVTSHKNLEVIIGAEIFTRRDTSGRLLLEDQPGERIWLPPGETTQLFLALEAPIVLHGKVLNDKDEPVPGAQIGLGFSADRRGPNARAISSAEGEFEIKLLSSEVASEAFLRASLSHWNKNATGLQTRYSVSLACRVMPLPHDGSEIVLRLVETLKIAGICVDEAGEPLPGELTVHYPDGPMGLQMAHGEAARLRKTNHSARFVFQGLLPGSYDIRFRAFGAHEPIWVRGVQAGEENLVITKGKAEMALLTVQLHGDASLGQRTFVSARLLPRSGELDWVPALSDQTTLTKPTGWPHEQFRGRLGPHYDYRGTVGEARFVTRSQGLAETTYELPPGYYWFGALARPIEGLASAPMGTGLVYLDPGARRLDFHLTPSGSARGKINGLKPGDEQYLAAALANGELALFALPKTGWGDRMRLPNAGSFALEGLPAGDVQLRVGTAKQIEAGRFTHFKDINIDPGGITEVEWQL